MQPEPLPHSGNSDKLEEIVVKAQRVERDGSRRNTAAGRDELDKTDQTSMDGFFDDIDGLSTLGGDDQGNAFSIDGLGSDLSNVTLNGQGFGEGGGSGGFAAGDLPPDMIRRVDIYKSPTASMEEGGAGGSVDLQLRNPVDITNSANSLRGRLGYVPDKNNFNPSASFFTGRSSASRKFGYMLNLTVSDTVKEYGSQDIPNWVLHNFEGAPAYIPSQVRNSAVTDNQRKGLAGLTVGFRPHPSLDISARVFLSQKQINTETHSLQHRIERQRNISILAFDGRYATELESSDGSRKNLRIVGGTREDQTDSLALAMGFNWRHARWRVAGAVGHNTDDSRYDSASQSATFEANSAFGYNTNNDGSMIMFYPSGFPPIQDFSGSLISLSDKNTDNTNKFAGIDLTRTLGNGFFRRIKFGGKFRETTRNRRSSKGRVMMDDSLTLADFYSGQHQQTPWDSHEWPSADLGAVNDYVQDSQVDWKINLLNVYDIERQSNAGYLQTDFRTNEDKKRFLTGNIGVRVVDTETWVAGFREKDGSPGPVAINTSYTDILPSLGIRMRVAQRAALTLGAAEVMTQPSFNDLAPGIRLNYADKTARAGNPQLDPFRASQFLAELTWVPERGRRLSGSIIYRDIESYFALVEESIEIDDDTYLVTRPVNGENGYILSASVRLEQNLRRLSRRLRNLALSISYIHNKSSTDMRDPYTGHKLPVPNTVEQVFRTDLIYSKNTFTGKLSYQWRGKSLKSSVSESGLSVWNQPVGSLNLNLGWQLNETLQFSFDARNLLNEEPIQTSDHDNQLWRIRERDRSIALTLRAKW
jgi:iron complex outermembrane receptor protein